MIRAALLALTLFILGAPVARAQDSGRFEALAVPTARIAPSPRVTVWLPPGYDSGRRRYGVLYMHDGQNLFDRARSNFDKIWAADAAVRRLIAARRIAPVIIVGVDQPGPARYRQYFPQALRAHARPAVAAEIDTRAGGPLIGDAYLDYLATELKPAIDRRFRTRPGPAHTAIAGSSMGGLISLYALAERLAVFGRAAALSMHSPLGDPVKLAPLQAEVIAAWDGWLAADLGPPAGRRLWIDRGDQTLDQHYAPYHAAIEAKLATLGWRAPNLAVRAYPGTPHEENAWAARLDEVLAWTLAP